MRTIPAREIKRRGITAVDEAMKDGPVYVIKNDRPSYVIMDDAHYRELFKMQKQASIARVKVSFKDIKAGRVRKVTAQKLVDELGLED